MKPATYREALAYVNAERKKDRRSRLDFLPAGTAGSSTECPLSRAGVVPRGAFVGEFDRDARGLGKVDPWVLVEGRIAQMTIVKTLQEAATGAAILEEMNGAGDTKHTWDPGDPGDVATARTLFDALRKRGMRIFRVAKGGAPGSLMTSFDPAAERMVAVPQIVGG